MKTLEQSIEQAQVFDISKSKFSNLSYKTQAQKVLSVGCDCFCYGCEGSSDDRISLKSCECDTGCDYCDHCDSCDVCDRCDSSPCDCYGKSDRVPSLQTTQEVDTELNCDCYNPCDSCDRCDCVCQQTCDTGPCYD